jgi:hypothetical protein
MPALVTERVCGRKHALWKESLTQNQRTDRLLTYECSRHMTPMSPHKTSPKRTVKQYVSDDGQYSGVVSGCMVDEDVNGWSSRI